MFLPNQIDPGDIKFVKELCDLEQLMELLGTVICTFTSCAILRIFCLGLCGKVPLWANPKLVCQYICLSEHMHAVVN